eukprot:Opistho-2@28211
MSCPFLTGNMAGDMANPHLGGFPDLKDDPMLSADAHYVTPGMPDLDKVKPGDWVDILGNGLLRKQLLKRGRGKRTMPRDGDKVTIHCFGSLKKDGTTFMDTRKDNAPLSFWLGEGEVPWGWDIGLPLWEEGEVARLASDHTYGYGDAGLPPSVPPKTWVDFEIELVSVERRPVFGEMSAADRIAYAKSKRTHGKKQFADRDPDAAAASFALADIMFQRASAVVLKNRLEELRRIKDTPAAKTEEGDDHTRMAATLEAAFPGMGDLGRMIAQGPGGAATDETGAGGLLTPADRRVWVSCLNWLTRVRLDMKMNDGARDASSRAMLLDPKNPKTLAQAAWLLITLGDNMAAAMQALRALHIKPECSAAKKVVDELEVTAPGDVKDARAEFKRVLAREKKEAKAERDAELGRGGIPFKMILLALVFAALSVVAALYLNPSAGGFPISGGGQRIRTNQRFTA